MDPRDAITAPRRPRIQSPTDAQQTEYETLLEQTVDDLRNETHNDVVRELHEITTADGFRDTVGAKNAAKFSKEFWERRARET